MSDDYSVDETQPQDPMEQFTGLFKSPIGQAMAHEAQVRINDYMTRRQIADDNTAAGEAFSNNLAEMRGNFIGMVRDDPHATPLALDLAHLGVMSMVGSVPGVDPAHIDNISSGVQRDIARAAVMTVAEKHEGAAQDLLDHPRIGGLLSDEKEHLTGYIEGQRVARHIDAQGAQKMAQKATADRANQTAWTHMAVMVDPDTGDISHPPDWAKRVMADPSMPPNYKATLFDVYGRLQEKGDAAYTDPNAASDLLRGAAAGSLHPLTALSAAGGDLRAADAVYLSRLAGDPSMKRRAGEISATLDAAQRTLAAPENGPAGQVAYQNFANWLLPTARDGADLNPSSKEYVLQGNRMQYFAPRATDMADYVIGQYNRGYQYDDLSLPAEDRMGSHTDRMDLSTIFGRSKTGDPVVNQRGRAPPINMPTARREEGANVPYVDLGARGPGRPSGDPVIK